MRKKNSQKSKDDILKAAETEFSENGLYGARIDKIAAKAQINKRMIYEYFGSKEGLYKAVLVAVYGRLGQREIRILSENSSCIENIKNIISLYFDFLHENPTYVNLLLWENLNRGRYIKDINVSELRNPAFDLLRKVIDTGKQDGIFDNEIDTEHTIISLLMYPFSYFSNRYTLSRLLGKDLDNEIFIRKSAENMTDMFLKYLIRKTAAQPKKEGR